jgi:hypothetical protein
MELESFEMKGLLFILTNELEIEEICFKYFDDF